uniref:Uncharacterized protein n=1 Tax=Heliothis virescens TaxID=7102 RepID=A0A2A4IXK2_HELVI
MPSFCKWFDDVKHSVHHEHDPVADGAHLDVAKSFRHVARKPAALDCADFTGTVEGQGDHGCSNISSLLTAPEREPDTTYHVHVEVDRTCDHC